VIHWPLAAQAVTLGVAGYGIGCFSAAYYVVRAQRGADIRTLHSGNAGATNAGLVLGAKGFALVFILDCLKGVAAVWLARLVEAPLEVRAVVAFAVVAGHIWPAQLRFRGGKGIATAIGAVPAAMPWLSLHLLIVALGALLATRRTHWAGLAAVCALVPMATGLGLAPQVTVTFVALAGIILWAHRAELRAVLERRAGRASRAGAAPP
jgi:acyl phosphate:glycerol-3-phosphate acyltransferase